MYSYFVTGRQRVIIGTSFSVWQEITSVVTQGSVLGPILFNLFINEFFNEIHHSQVFNFADNNKIYACGQNLDSVTSNIESGMKTAIIWYKYNDMVANLGKISAIVHRSKRRYKLCIDINGSLIQLNDSVKLLSVTIDAILNFNQYVQSICKKTPNQTRAFSRVAPNLEYEKDVLMLSFYSVSFTVR